MKISVNVTLRSADRLAELLNETGEWLWHTDRNEFNTSDFIKEIANGLSWEARLMLEDIVNCLHK